METIAPTLQLFPKQNYENDFVAKTFMKFGSIRNLLQVRRKCDPNLSAPKAPNWGESGRETFNEMLQLLYVYL